MARWLGLLLLGIAIGGPHGDVLRAEPTPRVNLSVLQKRRADLSAEFVAKLEAQIEECRLRNLPDGAAEIRQSLAAAQLPAMRTPALSAELEPSIASDATEDERRWRTQWHYVRKEYARQLYSLSRQALSTGHPALAFDLVREVVRHDPDHVKAREILGYVQYEKRWVTPYAKSMTLKGYVRHDDFGWLKKEQVARYEAGERFVEGKGGWMSQEKEAAIRQDFRNAWEIQTDHYLIRTNHSLEKGVELGKALEDFYEFFHQTFAGFFDTPEQLKKLFDGSTQSRNRVQPYVVHYYRTKEEYVSRLKSRFPWIEITNGFYSTPDKTAHFFHRKEAEAGGMATLYHEATHQLFFESHPQIRPIAEANNFWIIEGIACYMESFVREEGGCTVGNPAYIRFAAARSNYLNDHYYIPLRKFTAQSMADFQVQTVVVKNYTQASGLAHFFMHYDNGRYRDALIEHLAQLYSNSARKREHPQGLDELTGESFEELDRQYAEFLRECQAEITASRTATAP